MRGYMSLANADNPKEIPVEDRVGLYRIQERNQRVFAEVNDNVIPVGVSDPTVSRKKDSAPVEIVPRDEFIEVRNNGSHNPVTVDENATDGADRTVEEGAVATLQRDATVEIGYQTALKLVVERSRKKEVNVQGEKVVMGDEVDNSTTVRDSVVNRSDIGDEGDSEPTPADGGATTVDDSVVNRSTVGTSGGGGTASGPPGNDGESAAGANGARATDADGAGGSGAGQDSTDADDGSATQSYCEVHELTYAGRECPECATDGPAGQDGRTVGRDDRGLGGAGDEDPAPDDAGAARGGDGGGDSGEMATKYCLFCGEKIPAQALHCQYCGEQLPQ